MTLAPASEASARRLSDDVVAEQNRARQTAAARRARHRVFVVGIRAVSLAIVLSAWEIGGQRIDSVLFTTPPAVAVAAMQMIASGELWNYLWPSLVVLIVGLAISAVAGVTVGLLLARFWVMDVALDIYITFLYSTPTVALVPLIVLWVGFEFTAKIVILFLFAFFPLVINTYQGVKHGDPPLLA